MPEIVIHSQQEASKRVDRRLKKLQKNGYPSVVLGTSSFRKTQGMGVQYAISGQDLVVTPLENHGYKEPASDAAETIRSKALAAMIIFGFANSKEFSDDPSLQFEVSGNVEYSPVAESKGLLVDVQDSTTDVYPLSSNGEKGNPISLLKISRDYPDYNALNPEEAKRILEEDKQKYKKEVFSQPFQVVFEGARGVLSTGEERVANSVHLRFVVEFKGLPDDVIDAAYENPNVWNVGPRVDLASLVSERPDLVTRAEVIDLHKNKKKGEILESSKYSMVTDLIVYGRVNDQTMEKLLKKERKPIKENAEINQARQTFHRRRAIL